MIIQNDEIKSIIKEFFEILETREESDSGKEFNPMYISSCQIMKTKRINEIFEKLKDWIGY